MSRSGEVRMPSPITRLTRRDILQTVSAGFGYLAFAGLSTAAGSSSSSASPLAPKQPHFPATARRVIFLCMQGGPSHVDTFDHKPQLTADAGKGARYGGSRLMASPWEFRRHGESGLWISELFPEVAKHADDLCLMRSMYCDQPTHPRAMTQMHTGNAQFVRPSLGAWTLYGLGTENDSMPGFIALNPPAAAAQNYGSAFLPAVFQGTRVGRPGRGRPGADRGMAAAGPEVPDIANPRLAASGQRQQLDFIQELNQQMLKREERHHGVEGVIESYELAFRMQDVLPDLMDLSQESPQTLSAYGIGDGAATDAFGRQCLMARRFVESGVRFVELTSGGWDHHNGLRTQLPTRCREVDQPIAALLADLSQRGLLKDTLVIWGGEFGRSPDAPNGDGRDHNHKGYTIWMAGGGVKGGVSYGATDEHGYQAVENRCHVHDWHATILHLLGLDHQKLTYRYAGRDFRLTDVSGNVVHEIIGGHGGKTG